MNPSTATSARGDAQSGGSSPEEKGFFRDWAIFVREAIANPRDVGALVPSSQALARRMAQLVPETEDGLVVELGAGTGVVTKALLERGIPARRLVVLERSEALADLLRARFPGTQVICGDAADLGLLLRHAKLAQASKGRPAHVVSSLPLRSIPPDKVRAIIREIATLLRHGGHWIQYTYALRGRSIPTGFAHRSSSLVWQNVPPARIDVFSPEDGR